MESTERLCATCGKPLRGRIDKKFCDDYCRNAFNNQQNSDQNNYVRNINNILRRNRRLLEEMLPEDKENRKVSKEKLLEQGFHFRFHTHQFVNQKEQVYYFCYDYGYLLLEDGSCLVVRDKVQF